MSLGPASPALAQSLAVGDPPPGDLWGTDANAGQEELKSLSLDTLLKVQVRGASFFALPPEKVPNTSYKLESKMFSRLPVRTLADLLDATIPGLIVGNDRFFGPVLAQRGAVTDNNAKTVVMLDGQNLNQRFDYGYNIALALPLLGDLDSVEVIQGPAAILYGSGSISGFVNMLPKTGRTSPGLQFASELGAFGVATTAQMGYGVTYGPNRANDLYVYAGIARSGGFVSPAHDWTRAVDLTDNLQGGLQPSGKVTLNWHEGRLRVKGQFVDVWSTQAAGTLQDPPTGWHEGYLALRPEYTVPLATNQELMVIGSLMLHESGFSLRDERKLVPAIDAPTTPGDNAVPLPYTGRESNYVGRLVYKNEYFKQHKFAAGAEFSARQFEGNKAWFYAVPRDVAFDSLSRWNEYSMFAEDVLDFRSLLAVAGLRYDVIQFQGGYFVNHDAYDEMPSKVVSQVSPRFSLAYQFRSGLSARVAYQRGFRAANANDLQENRRLAGPGNAYWTPSGRFGGPTWYAPPDVVAPETVDSADINVHLRKRLRRVTFIGDVNGYYDSFNQYIVYDVGQRNAASRFASVGGEIVGKLQTNRGDFVQLSYGYSRPLGLSAETAQEIQLTDASRSNWRLYYPHQIKTTASVRVPGLAEKLSLGGAARYYSGLPAWSLAEGRAATADATWDESARQRALIAVSLSALYELSRRLQLKLVVENTYHNGTPVIDSYAGHPELTSIGLDRRLYFLSLLAKWD